MSGTHVDLVMKMPGYGGSAARYGRTITKLAQPSSHAGKDNHLVRDRFDSRKGKIHKNVENIKDISLK